MNVVAGVSLPPPPPPGSPLSATDYGWRNVRDDLERGCLCSYGWDDAAYWVIAGQKAGVDLTETESEFYLSEVKVPIGGPKAQRDWGIAWLF